MREITRQQLIEEILEQEYDAYDGEWEYVVSLLMGGCKGLANMTNEELLKAHYDGANIEIVKIIKAVDETTGLGAE